MNNEPPRTSPAADHLTGGKRRLLLLVTEYYYFKSHKKDVAETASRGGFDVVVAARPDGISREPHNFEVVELNWKRSGSLLAAALWFFPELYRVRRLLRKVRPDILHNVALKPVIIGSLAAFGSDIKIVNSINGFGFAFHDKSMFAKIVQRICGLVVRSSVRANNARIVLQNRDDAAFAKCHLKVPSTHVRLIAGSGVDTNRFTPQPEPAGEPFKFLILARLLYIKGIQIAVDAHSILRARGFTQELVICGGHDTGNPSSIPTEIVAQWSRTHGITFAGQLEDVRPLISRSHAVVHPALGGEGLPKALLEAGASGRAMIASDIGGNREVVISNKTGLLVPPGSPEALADAMQRVMNSPVERALWAQAARDKVAAEFALTRVLEQHLTLYREFEPVSF